jgi:hypothetical protein
MIEIRTSNGGRGTGTVIDIAEDHLWFVPNDPRGFRVMLVPVVLVTHITPT